MEMETKVLDSTLSLLHMSPPVVKGFDQLQGIMASLNGAY